MNIKPFTCEECGCVAAVVYEGRQLCPDCLPKSEKTKKEESDDEG